ncbi:hypothetical protein [Alkalibacillus haloalkaliphilus]|uniref:hypothetical protein n=1 Tax=Alkalibacillus haloalkaliphilus TaxID=94136 RepID=UPI000308DFBC|nr:hypothetical protein [Alkalibacillus haloalkaliphilus]
MKHRPYNCFIYSPEFTVEQRQDFPEVDPSKFKESAEAFSHLMADGSLMLNKLLQSDELAFNVMEAAQVNDLERVQQLLQGTGVNMILILNLLQVVSQSR